MATFPNYKPTYSATKKLDPKIRTVKFGDGYEQRLTIGLNQDPAEWSLTFILIDEQIKEIEDFLKARGKDAQSFTWTPPDEEVSYKWKCQGGWTKEMFEPGISRISTTFTQVFEP